MSNTRETTQSQTHNDDQMMSTRSPISDVNRARVQLWVYSQSNMLYSIKDKTHQQEVKWGPSQTSTSIGPTSDVIEQDTDKTEKAD